MFARTASLLLAAGLLLAACGDGDGDQGLCDLFPSDPLCAKNTPDGDVCTQAMEIVYSGLDVACQDYAWCCFCGCWLNGRQVAESDDPCTCVPVEGSNTQCDAEDQASAEECLADPETCRLIGFDLAESLCMEW